MTDYNHSTAKITAERNPMAGDIMETGANAWENINEIWEQLRKDYWTLSQKLANHGFDHPSSQIEAIGRLGELATALQAVDKARSALNTVRCLK